MNPKVAITIIAKLSLAVAIVFIVLLLIKYG